MTFSTDQTRLARVITNSSHGHAKRAENTPAWIQPKHHFVFDDFFRPSRAPHMTVDTIKRSAPVPMAYFRPRFMRPLSMLHLVQVLSLPCRQKI